MALFHFLVLSFSLCIYCKVDATSETLPNEQMRQVDDDFDCVDIYEQSALQHPLLKDHKIQFYPTFAKNDVRSKQSYDGECPTGKVPRYKMTSKHQIVTDSKLQFVDMPDGYHTVSLDTTRNMIYGGSASISIYNLSLKLGQSSSSLICVESGPPNELNSICAGITVHPALYGDSRPRLTTEWQANLGRDHKGCIDKQCAGFVQVTQYKPYIGAVQSPSTFIGDSGNKHVLNVKIQRDKSTGNWWLTVNEIEYVGYWPKELFTHLREGASIVRFVGQVWAGHSMLNPPMGSGRLPKQGYANAALFGELMTIDSNSYQIDVSPQDMKPYSNANPNCYDLLYSGYTGPKYRQAFLYGGPGGQNCYK